MSATTENGSPPQKPNTWSYYPIQECTPDDAQASTAVTAPLLANKSVSQAATPFLDLHKGKIVTLIAFLAIGGLAAGGVLLYLHVNSIAAYSSMGSGAFASVLTVISAIGFRSPEAKYKILTLNIGVRGDFGMVNSISKIYQDKENKNLNYSKAKEKADKNYREPSEEDKSKRKETLRTMLQTANADVILFQETEDFTTVQDLKDILTDQYEIYMPIGQWKEQDGAIAWKKDKFFDYIATAKLPYDHAKNPSAFVGLMPKEPSFNHALCLGTVHCPGFNLSLKKDAEKKQDRLTSEHVEGNTQLTQDIAIVEEFNPINVTNDSRTVTLNIMGGDLNAPKGHEAGRVEILRKAGYQTTFTGSNPTNWNFSLNEAVEMDGIGARADGRGWFATVQSTPVEQPGFKDFRVSDHQAVAAEVILQPYRPWHLFQSLGRFIGW